MTEAVALIVKLFREGIDSAEVDYDITNCPTVGMLKEELNLQNSSVSVNGIISNNNALPLQGGEHVSFNGNRKTGG